MNHAHAYPDLSQFTALLAATRGRMHCRDMIEVLSHLPNEEEAAKTLNQRMRSARLELIKFGSASGWSLHTHQDSGHSYPESAALLGLARLVEADGWRRVKRCQHSPCTHFYIDQTSGNNRNFCDLHKHTHHTNMT